MTNAKPQTRDNHSKQQQASFRRRALDLLGIHHVDDTLFIVAFAVWQLVALLNHCTLFAKFFPPDAIATTSYVVTPILVIAELLALKRGERWTRRSIVGVAGLVLMGACCFVSGRTALVFALLFIFCARNRDLLALARIALAILTGVLVATLVCAHFGILQNIVASAETRNRQFAGFRYPLYAAMILLSITWLIIILKNRDFSFVDAAVLLIANVLLFQLMDNRLSFWIAVLAIVIALTVSLVQKKTRQRRLPRRMVAIVFCSVFIVAAAVAIGITVAYDPQVPWLASLNTALGGRLALGHNAIVNFGITPFGQNVTLVGGAVSVSGAHSTGTYNFIDSVYVHYLVVLGVVYLVGIVAALTAATYKAFNSGNVYLGIVLVFMAVHGLIDNQTMYLWINPLLFSMALAITDKQEFPLDEDA